MSRRGSRVETAGGVGGARGCRPPAVARPADDGAARGRNGRRGVAGRAAIGLSVRDRGSRGISFQDIHPPLEVVDAYRDVSRAASDRQRRINEASAYRDQVTAEASGRAARCVTPPRPTRSSRLALAASDADTFHSLRDARRYDPGLTDFRLFWTKLAPGPGWQAESRSSTKSRAGAGIWSCRASPGRVLPVCRVTAAGSSGDSTPTNDPRELRLLPQSRKSRAHEILHRAG